MFIAELLFYGLSLGAVYSLIAVGFALIFNILKFSNFAHGGFITVTAYVGYIAASIWQLPFWAALLVAIFFGGIIGVISEFIAFRRIRNTKGPIIYYFVSSITLGILLESLIRIFFGTTYYRYPYDFGGYLMNVFGNMMWISYLDVYMLLVSLITLAILLFILYKTKIGLAIRSLANDVDTAKLMGVDVTRIIQIVFFVAGVLAAVSGVFLAISYNLYPALGQIVVKGFIASVIGGLGSLGGAVIGALLLGFVEIFLLQTIGSGFSPIVIFIIMLVFLLFRPRGIAGVYVDTKA
ncbi:MAG TPA: branched-chain amino acid ABC transporter permease [Halanaerobiales bacterium]|nr:branched-chain amino acid ABC transporter permease [Halanaerobiales bacterium]